MAFPPAQKELYIVSNVKAETREHCSQEKSEYLTCLKFNTTKDLSIFYFKLAGRQSGVCCSSGDRAGALPRNYNGGSLSVKGFSEVPDNFQLHHFFLSFLSIFSANIPVILCKFSTHTLFMVSLYF